MAAQTNYDTERERLVEAIDRDMRETAGYTGEPRLDPAVRRAIAAVPRHEFVPSGLAGRAYENRPLPIGHGQTISQPYVVALMTQLASLDETSRVLEIGTGSGYQAAVLAEIAAEVYTIEIVEALGREAAAVLARLGYDNVTARIGDGYGGWPDAAPFDAIVVTAAPDEVPEPLIEQLADGGRMVIPVGPEGRGQSLTVLSKTDGIVETDVVLPVMFVPFTRDE